MIRNNGIEQCCKFGIISSIFPRLVLINDFGVLQRFCCGWPHKTPSTLEGTTYCTYTLHVSSQRVQRIGRFLSKRLECLVLDVDVNCAIAGSSGGRLDGFVDVVDIARANRKEMEANRTAVCMESVLLKIRVQWLRNSVLRHFPAQHSGTIAANHLL